MLAEYADGYVILACPFNAQPSTRDELLANILPPRTQRGSLRVEEKVALVGDCYEVPSLMFFKCQNWLLLRLLGLKLTSQSGLVGNIFCGEKVE